MPGFTLTPSSLLRRPPGQAQSAERQGRALKWRLWDSVGAGSVKAQVGADDHRAHGDCILAVLGLSCLCRLSWHY